MYPLKTIIIISLSIFVLGCTKPVDFDQIDEATANPSYLLTLVNTQLSTEDFLDASNGEIPFIVDCLDIDIPDFGDSVLEKVEFTITTENSFNRNFVFNVIFFDEQNKPLYILQPDLNIPANSSELTTVLSIPKDKIDILFITSHVGFVFILEQDTGGDTLSGAEAFNLRLNSFVTFEYTFKLN
jgi:hypothetical protein